MVACFCLHLEYHGSGVWVWSNARHYTMYFQIIVLEIDPLCWAFPPNFTRTNSLDQLDNNTLQK